MSNENKRLATVVLGICLALFIIYYSGGFNKASNYAQKTELYQRAMAAKTAFSSDEAIIASNDETVNQQAADSSPLDSSKR
jgi:hypothetical protein